MCFYFGKSKVHLSYLYKKLRDKRLTHLKINLIVKLKAVTGQQASSALLLGNYLVSTY